MGAMEPEGIRCTMLDQLGRRERGKYKLDGLLSRLDFILSHGAVLASIHLARIDRINNFQGLSQEKQEPLATLSMEEQGRFMYMHCSPPHDSSCTRTLVEEARFSIEEP